MYEGRSVHYFSHVRKIKKEKTRLYNPFEVPRYWVLKAVLIAIAGYLLMLIPINALDHYWPLFKAMPNDYSPLLEAFLWALLMPLIYTSFTVFSVGAVLIFIDWPVTVVVVSSLMATALTAFTDTYLGLIMFVPYLLVNTLLFRNWEENYREACRSAGLIILIIYAIRYFTEAF